MARRRKIEVFARAQTPERAAQLLAVCQDLGWHGVVEVRPDAPEDISDIEARLSGAHCARTVPSERTPGRNTSCPCGSGRKYKRCCLARDALARG
jgi:SWIM/SEC-C metal-binding protein